MVILIFIASASGHKGLRFGNGFIAPTSNSTTVEDATTNLGLSTHRFKDAYLSGTANVSKVISSDPSALEIGTIGVVGNIANDAVIFSSTAGHTGIRLHSSGVLPTNNTGAITDATSDLGINTHRFKDLYLSGGVYLGGTGAANKLDDYEEGTWTPTCGGNNMTGGGQYTKIGNLVTVIADVTSAAGSATASIIGGLPFTVFATGHASFTVGWTTAASDPEGGYIGEGSTDLNCITGANSSAVIVAGERLMLTGTYQV